MLRIIGGLASIAILVAVVLANLRISWDGMRDISHTAASDDARSVRLAIPENAVKAQANRFAVTIRKPQGPPQIELVNADPHGRAAEVACTTCHSVRAPNLQNRQPWDLDQFHQGMEFHHGQLTCYACHHPDDMNTLRLADSTPVEFPDVMTLCAQCHGPQATAFAHGAHGGMNGFWDLSRGPQQRNNCIDCHDPHAPSFPKMIPTFKPRDRFLNNSEAQPESH